MMKNRDIRETLRALPQSYDDFVESTAECMEEYDDVRGAVLEYLRKNPESTPSDVLKVLCKCLGMTETRQFAGMRAAAY